MFGSREYPALQMYQTRCAALAAGEIARIEALTQNSPFPCGVDGYSNSRWLTTAIEYGNWVSINWVLS